MVSEVRVQSELDLLVLASHDVNEISVWSVSNTKPLYNLNVENGTCIQDTHSNAEFTASLTSKEANQAQGSPLKQAKPKYCNVICLE